MRLFLLCLCLLISLPGQAQVYKWVDEHGKTHYSDKPQVPDADTIQIDSAPGLDNDHESRAQKRQRLLKVLGEEREEKERQRAKAEAEKQEREQRCAKARKQLEEILRASFLYKKTDDPDNPNVYSQEKREEITHEARESVKKWCK